MYLIKKIAIFFFDLLDKYYHQKKIISFFLDNKVKIIYFFDIGAHKGSYTDLFIKHYKNLNIFMFEPQKNIFKILKKKYDNKSKIKIFNIAISNKNTKKKLSINEHDLTSSFSTFNENNYYLKLKAFLFSKKIKKMIKAKVLVKIIKLSNFIKVKKIKNIDLVKIDTEGHELEVLQGINKCISKIKYILIEMHNDNIYKNYNSNKIHNYLIKNNFRLKGKYKFPFTNWEDRVYKNYKYEYSRTSSKRNT